MAKLRNIDREVLYELITNCKRSDRELAKVIHSSQPTVTRSRTKIEKEGMILSYTAVPNLKKIGIEVIAFTFFSVKPEARRPKDLPEGMFADWKEETEKFYAKHPNIIFASTGRGLKKNTVWISLHKDYSCFVDFLRDIELNWGRYLEDIESFIVSIQSDRVRRILTLKYLPDYLRREDFQRCSRKN